MYETSEAKKHEVKRVTLAEHHAALRAQNKPMVDVTFECPGCQTLQSANDLIAAGAGESLEEVAKYVGFSCVGRFNKQQTGCNWTLGGLFQIHTYEVLDEDGTVHPHFEPKVKD